MSRIWTGEGGRCPLPEYAYTTNGKRWMISDANKNLTELVCDEHDRLDKMHFQLEITASQKSSATDYEACDYDGNDNRTWFKRRDGSIITYEYNRLNLLKRKAFSGRSDLAGHAREVQYSYDLRGNVEKMLFDSVAGEGLVQAMDALGHLQHSTITLDGVNRKLAYEYNAKLRTKVTHPDGQAFTYGHDDLDRIESIAHTTAGSLASFTYDAKGFPDVWTGGATTKFDFDDIGRLKTLEQDFLDTAHDNVYGYTRNPASQLTRLTTTNANFAPVTTPRSETYEVNGLNQYTTVSGATQTYDKNGNLTSDGETKYVYDYENRLVKASTTADVLKAELWYDPLGRLYKVQGPSGTTTFLYDGDELVAEYDSTNKVTQRYVHGMGVDDPIVWFEGSAVNAHSRRHLQSNHQGSIVAISNTAGRKLNVLRYDSWGKPQGMQSLRFGYTGQAWLPELGLWHYKARIYSPKLGRFLQTDPVGYEDQLNLYAYVGNDPWNMTDPSGTCGEGQPVDGCVVKNKIVEQPSTKDKEINPANPISVNGHAMTGDGSKRNADFTKVKLDDLGGSLQKIATQDGSTLNKAIAESGIKGGPVAVKMTKVNAGGGFGGKTPLSHKVAIGRFSVSVSGVVSSDGKGGWNMTATVRGEVDKQDYPRDPSRTSTASALTAFGSVVQSALGGQNYNISFFGAQEINIVRP